MIRQLEENDIQRANDLLKDFNYNLENIKNNQFMKVILYVEEKILGILVYELIYDRIEIDYILVDENYRMNGIGSKLLNYLILNNDVNNITLEVNENNTSAINLYKKYGFEIVAVRKKYYKNEDGLLMMKKLGV